MANKFPLILNTSANQIQEIASGDNLDLTGCGINNAGVITATSFSGNITGAVTGNSDTATEATNVTVTANNSTSETVYPIFVDGATGTQGAESDTGLTYNPSSGNLTSTQFTGTLQTAAQTNITSVGTLSALNVSGNVSIGGTLTYEDVTNIDSVGLITARTGVVSPYADIDDWIDVGSHIQLGNAGIVTAKGADINGDIDVDGHTNLDNVSIAGVTTFTGNTIRQNAGYVSINVGSTNAGGAALVLDGDSNGDFTGNDYSLIQHNTDGHLIIQANAPAAANVYIKLGASGHYGAMFKEGAESLLRYNNSTKIATTNTGAVITGICTATEFKASSTGNANLVLDSGTGGAGGNQVSYIDYKINGTVKANIACNEGVSGVPLEINSAGGTGPVQLFKAGSKKLETTSTGINVTDTITATGTEGLSASLYLIADDGDDNGDGWRINSNQDDNDLTISNNTSGSYVDKLTLTKEGNATFSSGVHFPDNVQLKIGNTVGTPDFKIYHDGNNRLHASNGYMQYRASAHYINDEPNSVNFIRCEEASSNKVVKIACNGNTKLETKTDGVQITGNIYANGALAIKTSDVDFIVSDPTDSTTNFIWRDHSASRLYLGVAGTADIMARSNVSPYGGNTYDLGDTTNRWRNVYTNDLDLSNESKKEEGGNEVDGTWGAYTIQEGEDDLFLINRRSGKKYKFNLTEVD